jgi:hypothetical protein
MGNVCRQDVTAAKNLLEEVAKKCNQFVYLSENNKNLYE